MAEYLLGEEVTLVSSNLVEGEGDSLRKKIVLTQGPACAHTSFSKRRKTDELRPQPETTSLFLRL